MVVNIFYFHPYLAKIPILTNIFQMGWYHQPDLFLMVTGLHPYVMITVIFLISKNGGLTYKDMIWESLLHFTALCFIWYSLAQHLCFETHSNSNAPGLLTYHDDKVKFGQPRHRNWINKHTQPSIAQQVLKIAIKWKYNSRQYHLWTLVGLRQLRVFVFNRTLFVCVCAVFAKK